jgi:hypothetical protein
MLSLFSVDTSFEMKQICVRFFLFVCIMFLEGQAKQFSGEKGQKDKLKQPSTKPYREHSRLCNTI